MPNYLETTRLHAKLDTYRRRVANTEERINAMLEITEAPYIALSCGKDSTVMADLILRQRRIPCRFVSSGETRIIHNVDDVLNYFKRLTVVEEINFDRVFSKEWAEASFDEQRKAGRRDIQSLNNDNYDGVFLGLRKEESRGRCISLAKCQTKGLPRYTYKYIGERTFYRFCPLADWTYQDVGAYIVEHNLPVLDWYTAFGFQSRTTARLTGDAIRQNTLFWIKCHNPEGYHLLIKRFPELSIY